MISNVKRFICGMLTLITIFSCGIMPSLSVFATETNHRKGSFTINYVDEGTKVDGDEYIKNKVFIDGATFSAVLVAREDIGKGRFEWVDDIKDNSNFTFDTENMFEKDKIEIIAKALKDTVADKLEAYTRTTDEKGQCIFAEVEEGIYIVWESQKEGTAERYHDAVPFLVEIPNRSGDSGKFDVEVYPKPSLIIDKRVSITGTKKWEGKDIVGKPSTEEDDKKAGVSDKKEEDKVYRPESITLRLYANGIEVAKTTTNAKKGWAFSFDDVNTLDENGNEVTFTIKEDKIKGYIFSQDKPIVGENTIVINVKNKVGEPSAQTGDDTNMILWLAVAMICLISGLSLLLIPEKKKKQTLAEKAVEKYNQQN